MSLFQRIAGAAQMPGSNGLGSNPPSLSLWRIPGLACLVLATLLNGCANGGGKAQIASMTFASNAQGTNVVCTTASLSSASTAPVCSAATLPTVVVGGSSSIYIFANVANDDELLGITWTVTCGSSGPVNLQSVNTACGTFSPVQTLSGPIPIYQTSGIVTTYTAPSQVPKGGTVTLTASATSQPTVTLSVTLAVVSGAQSRLEPAPGGKSRPTKPGIGNKSELGV